MSYRQGLIVEAPLLSTLPSSSKGSRRPLSFPGRMLYVAVVFGSRIAWEMNFIYE